VTRQSVVLETQVSHSD